MDTEALESIVTSIRADRNLKIIRKDVDKGDYIYFLRQRIIHDKDTQTAYQQ